MKKLNDFLEEAKGMTSVDIRLLINELIALVWIKSRQEYVDETLRESAIWETIAPKRKTKSRSPLKKRT